jgi:hypothetical protein
MITIKQLDEQCRLYNLVLWFSSDKSRLGFRPSRTDNYYVGARL